MNRHLAYLSGSPRVSTKPTAAATGARQHVLGTIRGFEANNWVVDSYIVGDHVPERWLKTRQEHSLNSSLFKRVVADILRIAISLTSIPISLLQRSNANWVYERAGPFLLLGYFFKGRGIPWILESNSLMCKELVTERRSIALRQIVQCLELFAYKHCDILVVISEDLKHAIVETFGIDARKIVVLPNAADTETFNPAVNIRRLFPEATFVIGFQGSMYKWAGLEYLIRAIAKLRSRHLNVAAVLLGDGHERFSLEALARELGIQEYVIFPGLVSRDLVPNYIAGYDICFSGQVSLTETPMYLSPLKLYDYMAVAKPVLASRFPDAISLTNNGQIGYLFRPGDLDDLVDCATRAYQNRAGLKTMGLAARSEIVARHSWRSRIEHLIRIVDEKLQQGSSEADLSHTAVHQARFRERHERR